ncbi:unnamed protein product, partial [marine sediment metagenome]
ADKPSQAGEPQPLPAGPAPAPRRFPAVVAGRPIPAAPGHSSATARRRAVEDEIERLVQTITDRIVQAGEART